MAFQVFISYATADDAVPVGSSAKYGFVTLLRENLEPTIKQLGGPPVTIWRDVDRIRAGEQFGPEILEAIDASQMLVFVLTPLSLASRYCQDELKAFVARWPDDPNCKDRLIVALRSWIEPTQWPQPLTGQRGFRFFTKELNRDSAPEIPLYRNDGTPAPGLYDVINEMAVEIHDSCSKFRVGPPSRALGSRSCAGSTGERIALHLCGSNSERYGRSVQQGRGCAEG